MSDEIRTGKRWVPRIDVPDEPHTPHPTTKVEWQGITADIDTEIAPLILLVWQHGIDTIACCQDQGGRVHIEFSAAADLSRLLELVVEPSDDVESLYNRVSVNHEPDDWEAFRVDRIWHYSASFPIDLNWGGHTPRFEVPVAVFFPRFDLPAVVGALEARRG